MANRIKVVFAGATGKTGSEVLRYLLGEDDLEIVAAVARNGAGNDLGQALGTGFLGIRINDSLEKVLEQQEADVLVDFTAPQVAGAHSLQAVMRGVRPVIGTTGMTKAEIDRLMAEVENRGLGAAIIPNFSFGIMLLTRFIQQAAGVYPHVEIVEKHHQTKLDAPSGTAAQLARRLQEAGVGSVPIHSVRLPGHVAHHEIIFGGTGEVLTLKHDTISRSSFGPGVALAVRKVLELKGMVFDLAELMSF